MQLAISLNMWSGAQDKSRNAGMYSKFYKQDSLKTKFFFFYKCQSVIQFKILK